MGIVLDESLVRRADPWLITDRRRLGRPVLFRIVSTRMNLVAGQDVLQIQSFRTADGNNCLGRDGIALFPVMYPANADPHGFGKLYIGVYAQFLLDTAEGILGIDQNVSTRHPEPGSFRRNVTVFDVFLMQM